MPQSRVPVGPASLIVEIARLIRKDFGQRAEHLNLTQSQWRALYQISHRPGINQAKLAEKLEVHPVSVTQVVDRLVKAGWVVREPDPMDRRAVQLQLTQACVPLLEEMDRISIETRETVLAGLDDAQRKDFEAVLRHVRANLRQAFGADEHDDL